MRAVSTVDALVEDLTNRVLNGELEPTQPLREVQLAHEYNVGRHSVRAALQRLAYDGLVHLEPNRGATVPRLTSTDVRDLYWLRAILEEKVARCLTERRIVPEAAKSALDAFEAITDEAPWHAVVEADVKLHQSLVAAVGSSRLDRMYRSLLAEIRLCIAQLRPFYASPSKLALEHRALLEAIATGSVEQAVATMRAHLEQAVADLTRDESAPSSQSRDGAAALEQSA